MYHQSPDNLVVPRALNRKINLPDLVLQNEAARISFHLTSSYGNYLVFS